MIILKMEMEMIQILLIEGVFLCIVFWGVCWLGTGSDEKNIRNFSSYPRAVQKIVSTRPELAKKILQRSPVAVFTNNLLLFSFLLFALGIFTRQENFAGNFFKRLAFGAGAESV